MIKYIHRMTIYTTWIVTSWRSRLSQELAEDQNHLREKQFQICLSQLIAWPRPPLAKNISSTFPPQLVGHIISQNTTEDKNEASAYQVWQSVVHTEVVDYVTVCQMRNNTHSLSVGGRTWLHQELMNRYSAHKLLATLSILAKQHYN